MTHNEKIVEAVARAIDPDCFSDFRRAFDYEMKISGNVEEARNFAKWSAGAKIDRAKEQACAAITAFQAEAWQGEETEFEVWQDGMPVAGSSGPRERALAEAMHYAQVYGQDGPVSVCEVVRLSIGFPNPPASP